MHRARIIILAALLLAVFFRATAYGAREAACETLETGYASIYCRNDGELISFGRNIDAITLFNRDKDKSRGLIARQVDLIVTEVRKHLDMYPSDLRFNIRIYSTYVEIEAVYMTFAASGKPPIAFYSHRTRSIYVSNENVTDGVLAHEIAHAVINFYFVTPPPSKMQEILAQYVDRHLWDAR